jgi:hypothetical protein
LFLARRSPAMVGTMQKTMGIIMITLVAGGLLMTPEGKPEIPTGSDRLPRCYRSAHFPAAGGS